MAKNNTPKPTNKPIGKPTAAPKPKADSPGVKRINEGAGEKRGDQGKFGVNRPPTKDNP